MKYSILITECSRAENPLSVCQVMSKKEITIFLSLSDRPNTIAREYWIEWFTNTYEYCTYYTFLITFSYSHYSFSENFYFWIFSLPIVKEFNTLFIHVFLFRCVKNIVYLPLLLETIYVEMPEIKNIILIKMPGTMICNYKI